jgi:hypothetical protein
MKAKWFGALTIGGLLVFAACDIGTGPGDVTDEAAIAGFLADMDNAAGWGRDGTSTSAGPRDLNQTVNCPAGGTHSTTGSGSSTINETTKVLTRNWTTTQAHDDCAFTRTGRDGATVKVVIDGSVTVSGNSTTQLPATRGAGEPVLLTFSSTRSGSTTTTVGDKSHTCEVNVTETYDPATKTFTIKGTVCGRTVDTTRGTKGGR